MTEARILKQQRSFTLEDMYEGIRLHHVIVQSGYAGRRAQAPRALARGERLGRGFVTFSAPSGRGQGQMNRVTLNELRQQVPKSAAKGNKGDFSVATVDP
eukprot:3045890-Pyramimonas_sp.AAC.1